MMRKATFRALLAEKGYEEPAVRKWAPNLSGEMHTHDRSVMLLMTDGLLTLEYETAKVDYRPGDVLELAAHTLHNEITGDEGAVALMGMK